MAYGRPVIANDTIYACRRAAVVAVLSGCHMSAPTGRMPTTSARPVTAPKHSTDCSLGCEYMVLIKVQCRCDHQATVGLQCDIAVTANRWRSFHTSLWHVFIIDCTACWSVIRVRFRGVDHALDVIATKRKHGKKPTSANTAARRHMVATLVRSGLGDSANPRFERDAIIDGESMRALAFMGLP